MLKRPSDNLDIRKQYEKLRQLDADLTYVCMLQYILEVGDTLLRINLGNRKTKKAKSEEEQEWRTRRMLAKASHRVAIAILSSSVKTSGELTNKIVDIANEAFEEAKESKPPQKFLDREDYPKLLIEAFNPGLGHSYLSIMMDYALRAQTYKTGRHPDRWGTLFLLVLTEHLRETNGDPSYGVAGRLLKAIRGEHFHLRNANKIRKTTEKRVHSFQDLHPDWPATVKAISKPAILTVWESFPNELPRFTKRRGRPIHLEDL